MEPPQPTDGLVTALAFLGGVSGLLPIAGLFLDHRKRGHRHKPLLFLAVLAITLAAIPSLLDALGLWLALFAPLGLIGIVLLDQRPSRFAQPKQDGAPVVER